MIRPLQQIAAWWLKRRMARVQAFVARPVDTQMRVLDELLAQVRGTAFGQAHGLQQVRGVDAFRAQVPVRSYEEFYPYIEQTLQGAPNVLWPGTTTWFSKSSGTTNAKAKFIPMPPASLHHCHYACGQDMLALYLHNHPDSRLFAGKSLSVGGSHEISRYNQHARYGDLSAVLIQNMPGFYEHFRTPSRAVSLMHEWEAKLTAMAKETYSQRISMVAGVPTWTVVLLERLMAMRGHCPNGIHDVWPNLELFIHGAVAFTPYRAKFAQLIPNPRMRYLETYNASEGFFALQDDLSQPDLLLMLDYGIFYEFVPMEQLGQPHPRTLLLDEVELGKNYAMVISTNGGLWRYLIGDTVRFTQKYPHKILITGRTKHFINAFGEELVIENADAAIAAACAATGAVVNDYTAAPIYFSEAGNGGHEWVIEFAQQPTALAAFVQVLDDTLKQLNGDYEAKRYKDMAMRPPLVHAASVGTFYNWLKMKGKLGGQNKVPRLANDRTVLDEVMLLLKKH